MELFKTAVCHQLRQELEKFQVLTASPTATKPEIDKSRRKIEEYERVLTSIEASETK